MRKILFAILVLTACGGSFPIDAASPTPSQVQDFLDQQRTADTATSDSGAPVSTSESAIAPAKPDEFYMGRVESIRPNPTKGDGASVVSITITSGPDKGKVVDLPYPHEVAADPSLAVKPGQKLVMVKSYALGKEQYYIADQYRTPYVLVAVAIFFALVIFFGRFKGFTSILGLAFSIFILGWFVLPRIVAGQSPIGIVLAGSAMILVVSLYLAHGFNRRTTLSLIGSVVTLGIAILCSLAAVSALKLFGMGSEETFLLQTSQTTIDFRGLLLGGIIIGVLGVLDDITTAQTAVVAELKEANRTFGFRELYRRGLVVGREHIASLVNTLVLAYAGASLPLFLLFFINQAQPWWVILNSEFIVEELARTLVGSVALVAAVPIATALAAYYYGRRHRS